MFKCIGLCMLSGVKLYKVMNDKIEEGHFILPDKK